MSHRVSDTISDETLSRIIHIESAGNPRAKARTSSATGLGQFLNATWLACVRRHRPEWMEGRSQAQVLALRLDPRCSIEMLARFTEDNAAALPGEEDGDGDLYLAHFAGVGVAKKLIRAPGHLPASAYFSPAAIAANRSILEGKSVEQVRAWAERKMRSAGGKGWIDKFWQADPPRVPAARADAPVPREADPENEWTYENPAPEPPKKTGITEGAAATTGLGILGTLALIWEKITELPASVLELIVKLAQKPSFWFVVAVAAVGAFIWWRRRNEKVSADYYWTEECQ